MQGVQDCVEIERHQHHDQEEGGERKDDDRQSRTRLKASEDTH